MKNKKIADIRRDYQYAFLLEENIPNDPFVLFHEWLNHAIEISCLEPTAMVLSTISPENRPASRVVLLKTLSKNGFTFFSNYTSRKARNLEINPFASLNFLWAETERQVRIEGKVVKVSDEESDAYFLSRPPESRLGAWASPQSSILKDRSELEDLLNSTKELMSENINKRPPHWGGYCLIPDLIEFWQGRPNRLHDRLQYRKVDNNWIIERLAP